MTISEEKMRIVINNYFKTECDVNTSIRQAFEKGFRIGVKKGLSAQPKIIRCKDCKHLQKWRSEESAKEFGQIYACARNVFNCPKPEDFCSFAERRAE